MGRSKADVVVVGAGIIGCAIAREVAPNREVLVLDRAEVGGGASGLAAGLTAPTLFYHRHPAVAEHANQFLRDFDGTDEFEFTERPRIEILPSGDEDRGRTRVERMRSSGFPVSFLEAETAENRYPSFDFSDFAGVVEIGDAGFVDDPYEYTRALEADAERRGATFRSGVTVNGVLTEGRTVTGVHTDDGVVESSAVVCAAGWRTRALLNGLVELPVRPFVLQCVTADPAEPVDDVPLGRLASEEVYFRPQHNGKLRFGGGEYLVDDPEELTNGATETQPLRAEKPAENLTAQEAADAVPADEGFKNHASAVVSRFLRSFAHSDTVTFEREWKGVGSATPDGEPIIDRPDDAPDGLFVATGFNGLGVTIAPVAATLIEHLITDTEAPFPREIFTLDRFESRTTNFDLQDTFDRGLQ